MRVAQSCPALRPHGLHSAWNSPGRNPGAGSLSLLQGIFPTQVSHITSGFLTQLSHRRSPNTGVRASFQISVFVIFRYIPGAAPLSHTVVLFLVLQETLAGLSSVAAAMNVPKHSAQGFPFPTPPSTFVICGVSDNGILTVVR